MDRLNSKDMLTADNVMAKVHEHNDTILFPRLRNRFGDTNVPPEDVEDDASLSLSAGETAAAGDNAVDRDNTFDNTLDNDQRTEEQKAEGQGREGQGEGQASSTGNGLASTLPAPSSSSSKPRPNTTGGRLSKTATASSGGHKPSLRPKSPTSAIGIKMLSKSKINETLDMMKVRQALRQGSSCHLLISLKYPARFQYLMCYCVIAVCAWCMVYVVMTRR